MWGGGGGEIGYSTLLVWKSQAAVLVTASPQGECGGRSKQERNLMRLSVKDGINEYTGIMSRVF